MHIDVIIYLDTSFGGLKKRLGNYIFKSFSVKLYSQYLLRSIMYYLLRYYKEPDTASGIVLQKSALEFLIKVLD